MKPASNSLFKAIAGMQESHFTYDANGNMLTDTRRGMRVEYNTLNLPAKVWRNDTLIATYSYLADGTNVKNKTSIFFRDGYGLDLIPQNILNSKKGYKYE